MVLDLAPIGDGAGIGIDVGLEGGNTADQILSRGVAVMVGDIPTQPAPQRLDCHHAGCRKTFLKKCCVALATPDETTIKSVV